VSITFNPDDIYEMAVEIEKNANKFYNDAAEKASEDKTKKMFVDFADMEKGHAETFEQMRKQLSDEEKESDTFDPQGEGAMYLQSMAEAHGWEGKKNLSTELTGNESMDEVVRIALNAEKNSIAFYLGLRDMVPGKNGRDRINEIIKEEMDHVKSLNNILVNL
jgi:rubrerythrin